MKYVVLGASAAGINGVRELRRLDKDADITLHYCCINKINKNQ